MMCALIANGVVADLRDLTEEQINTDYAYRYEAVVDITSANPTPLLGWAWNGTRIVTPAGYAPSRKITKLGLRRRLTFNELVALTAAARTNDMVGALKDNLMVATFVDLSRADTIQGIGMLVSLGLLTAERANIILTAPIAEDERYLGDV